MICFYMITAILPFCQACHSGVSMFPPRIVDVRRCIVSMVKRTQIQCMIDSVSHQFFIKNKTQYFQCLCKNFDECCCFEGSIIWAGALKGALIIESSGNIRYNGSVKLSNLYHHFSIKFSKFGRIHVE